MATSLDMAKELLGAAAVNSSAGAAREYGAASVRHGTVAAIDGTSVDIEMDDTGSTIYATTSTPLTVGDAVTVVICGQSTLVYSTATLVAMIDGVADDVAAEVEEIYAAISDAESGLNDSISALAESVDSASALASEASAAASEAAASAAGAAEAVSQLEEDMEEAAAETLASATARYATCSTAASTAYKVAVCDDFYLYVGATLAVAFDEGNTTSATRMKVADSDGNDTTSYAYLYAADAVASADNCIRWTAGATITFMWDGSYWVVQNHPITYYATCSTGASEQLKTVTLDGAVMMRGTQVQIGFTNGNSYTGGAVRIQLVGSDADAANPAYGAVYFGGTVTSADNPMVLLAGTVLSVTRGAEGSWHVAEDATSAVIRQTSDGLVVGKVEGGELGTHAVHIDGDGVYVRQVDDATPVTTMTADGFSAYAAGSLAAYFGADGAGFYQDGALGAAINAAASLFYADGALRLGVTAGGVAIYGPSGQTVAALTGDGVMFFDGAQSEDTADNALGYFSGDAIVVGDPSETHLEVSGDGLLIVDADGNTSASVTESAFAAWYGGSARALFGADGTVLYGDDGLKAMKLNSTGMYAYGDVSGIGRAEVLTVNASGLVFDNNVSRFEIRGGSDEEYVIEFESDGTSIFRVSGPGSSAGSGNLGLGGSVYLMGRVYAQVADSDGAYTGNSQPYPYIAAGTGSVTATSTDSLTTTTIYYDGNDGASFGFTTAPVITLTPSGSTANAAGLQLTIASRTTTGFTAGAVAPAAGTYYFHWMAAGEIADAQ